MEARHWIIDSSVFVAFYRDVDSQHVDAVRVMEKVANMTLIVHPYVIQETATVLAYKVGLEAAKKFCLDVISAGNVIIPSVDARYDVGRFTDIGKKVSFTDAALVELSRTSGAEIITFDKELRSLIR